ncbi:MAG: class I SAM-dependent methyltransferase [Pyrinomonadaceae bacterium]
MTPYDDIAEQWHAAPRGFAARVYVEQMLEGLAPGARVLDLGCGTGEPVARHIAERGFRLVCVDESAKMLEIARRVVPGAEFVRADMRALNLEGTFAAAVAWDSLFHVERDSHREIFRKLWALLDAGGRLLLSAGGTGHAGFTSEMYGRDFFYSAHEPAEAVRLLASEGFAIELCEEDDSSSRGHLAIVARRVARKVARRFGGGAAGESGADFNRL